MRHSCETSEKTVGLGSQMTEHLHQGGAGRKPWTEPPRSRRRPNPTSLPVLPLPRAPASSSVEPMDERMTLESLPQLEGLMLLTKPPGTGLLHSQPGCTDLTLTLPVN